MYFPDCWFKYPSIAFYGKLYEKVIKVYSGIRYNNSGNYYNNPIRDGNRHLYWKRKGSQLSSYHTYFIGGINRFFAYYLEKRDQRNSQRDQQITGHCNKLITKFEDKLNGVSNISDFSWKTFFDSFEYSKEFRQHLFTGHKELYDLLNRVIESEKLGEETFDTISVKVKQRIRKKARELEIPIPKIKNYDPTFDIDSISKGIIEEYELNSNDNIVYKDTGEHSAILKSKILQFHQFDHELAVKFIGKLNEIINDSYIWEGITKYRNIRKIKQENATKFTELLKDL